ncbi:type II toxin-antitoxin system HicA family toxin [Romeria aff. gracilis LEGE 07310]|uniref:Type II toxin-antitoxin system HicA family toxin n=1 Tax=Vasconcelosia minhoensis LEGE 07310 TaxID=915328 RepID=A0A8J7AM33_9CYAN|nr:type II toxin-antitoxin system HicA family toxin [Romeria gracilis]MBE9077505.1 type II toxin-antitoxin system HicA family toxin [Romeria aff. gracilis LEGE 07310]
MTSREIISRLKVDGWVLVDTKGSHQQFKHPNKKGRVTVPHPKKSLPIGTVRSIARQASWDWPLK